MKNQWLVWAFIAGVIVIVIIAFNSENQRKTVRYAEDVPAEVQYEDEVVVTEESAPAVSKTAVPAVESVKQAVVQTAQETYQIARSKAGVGENDAADQAGDDADQALADPGVKVLPVIDGISDFTGVAYTIQILSVRELADARRVMLEVQNKNHPAYIVERNLGEKGIWYRIYVGTFGSKADADAYLTKVRKDYASAFVIAPYQKKQ